MIFLWITMKNKAYVMHVITEKGNKPTIRQPIDIYTYI